MNLKASIKKAALNIGFDRVGIASAQPIETAHRQALEIWLKNGFAGRMQYMQNHLEKRLDPALLLEGARSVICLAVRYQSPKALEDSALKIADYARYEDYHTFFKQRLFQLARAIDALLPDGTAWKYKPCVDTAPLAERAMAQRAGLGFIGRNHLLIHPQSGARLLLGELITTLELEPDAPVENTFCSDCDRCIRACPTGALQADGTFNTLRCISYITQYGTGHENCENKLENNLFGCDECIRACPVEQQASSGGNPDLHRLEALETLTAEQVLRMDEKEFNIIFTNSCIRFIGLAKLRENARRCLLNRGKTENQGTRKMSS